MHEQSASSDAQLLVEYQELRKEMLQNEMLTLHSLIAFVVLASALMTTAFSDAVLQPWIKAILFFGAESVALLSLWQSAVHVEGNYWIGAYIAVFIEPRLPGVQWENRGRQYRLGERPPNARRVLGSRRIGQTALILMNLLLGNLYMYWYLSQNHQLLIWIVPLGSVLATAYFLRIWTKHYTTRHNREYHVKRWERVRAASVSGNVPASGSVTAGEP